MTASPAITASAPWMTPAEVADRLHLDPPSVLKLIHAGELVGHDLSMPGSRAKRYRISPDDLAAFLLRRRSQPPSRPARRKQKPVETSTYY